MSSIQVEPGVVSRHSIDLLPYLLELAMVDPPPIHHVVLSNDWLRQTMRSPVAH